MEIPMVIIPMYCPSCKKNQETEHIKRTVIEKFRYRKLVKFKCNNCKSIFFYNPII